MKINKAVIPAAGFGTRFLPATKAIPKEMLPVAGKPVIQYVVEEAVAAGITEIIIVVNEGKNSIEEHFRTSPQLEYHLGKYGKVKEKKLMRAIEELANIRFVIQKEQKGLGDAIRCARNLTGNDDFAVLLGDAVFEYEEESVIGQLVKIYEKYQSPVVALESVELSKISRYGVIKGLEIEEGLFKAEDFVEKPTAEHAPSNLAFAARYIFTPEIYDCIDATLPGINNEIQVTDAMRLLLKQRDFYGYRFSGKRHDIGNPVSFIKSNVIFGLKTEGMKEELESWLEEFKAGK